MCGKQTANVQIKLKQQLLQINIIDGYTYAHTHIETYYGMIAFVYLQTFIAKCILSYIKYI